MADYIALIHKDADSAFGVSFPDLPGCISVGETLEEARANAEEAPALHVDGMIEDGETLPAPSALDEVMANPGNRDRVVILVPLKTAPPRTVRVNITLPRRRCARSTPSPKPMATCGPACWPAPPNR